MPRPTPDDDLLDLPALLADAAVAAMTLQRPAPFLDWLRANLLQYAAPSSQLVHDEELQHAFTTALGRALWNAMPLPRRGFLTEPIPEPGRNDPCPCGSGRKFKHCCARAPSLGPFTTPLVWPYVLRTLSGPTREAALRSSHLPREAVLQYASDEIEAENPDAALELLEPMLAEPVQHEDNLAAAALDLLCNAYDARGNAKRRKSALLERIGARPSRSPLRSAAHQRLACILMDRGQARAAWAAFRSAQQDDPGNRALGLLEVQLLLGEGRSDEARERARFFLRQLRRSGADLDPGMLEFYEQVAADPGRAMSDVAFDMEQGAGRRLADWLDRVRSRPLPVYTCALADDSATPPGPEAFAERLRQMGVAEPGIERAVADLQRQLAELEHQAPDAGPDDEAPRPQDGGPGVVLIAPGPLAAIEERWRAVFPLDKPFSVHPLPWGDTDPWAPGIESQWMELLERHPEAFDSLDVLDDLTTATMTHGQSGQPAVIDRLSRPLLERSVAILERALADSRSAVPPARVRWAMTENRPALRSLFRLHELAMQSGRDADARRLAERLIALNPDDNHGVRCWLAGAYLKADDADACLRLVEAYRDDGSPELRLDAALALYRLGRARSATEALQSTHREMPRVTRYLLAKRIARPKLSEHGVSFDGDDRGWLYREDMRSTWAATPGALEWATKVLRP
jgi:tetratricopeptide (TPR) repeat protein